MVQATRLRLFTSVKARSPELRRRFIEISRKVALVDAAHTRDELEAILVEAGVPICADQSAQAVNKLRALLGGS